ncbi:MAG: proline--tRNA ligase [Burkholderiales bacterium]|jgi:prolyl-tRNA synthetase|nr:proline--tRNA ligase [Burkholderiales bacterium]
MAKTAITPTRHENYPEWYQQVIIAADLAENSAVRGCMVIKPWGYALWENIQAYLDKQFKASGHVNAYFPLLIPLSYLEKEAEHVDGFAKECAVVTHHRLKADGNGGLIPDGELEEPLVIRPTSETIIGESYAKWVKSYRDLPILINQWANVMRWEMRTRLFLRTTEFLWQEGHTVHATEAEAVKETLMILELYTKFAEEVLAIPVIRGKKPVFERFPGAVDTYTIEAMMQDGKALQAATSHFLGQNFAKASNIQFLNKDNQLEHAWTTSWGISTRIIGGLIMTHSDDDGLVLPPKIASKHVVILPIYKNDTDKATVLEYCNRLKLSLEAQVFHGLNIIAHIDDKDIPGGEKKWGWVKKGVPLLLEIGARDIANNSFFVMRRDVAGREKQSYTAEEFTEQITTLLDNIQQNLFKRAADRQTTNSIEIASLEQFKTAFAKDATGFVTCYACNDPAIEEFIKPLQVTARCIPLNQGNNSGICIFTGKKVQQKIIFAKSY